MTPPECLRQFAELGLLPADQVDEILRVSQFVDRERDAGRMTDDQAFQVLDNHAARIVDSRIATQGAYRADEKQIVGMLVDLLDAGAPS